MITLERLVELRADSALQTRFGEICGHVVAIISSKTAFQARIDSGHVELDAEFIALSQAMCLAIYEEGRLAGLSEAAQR